MTENKSKSEKEREQHWTVRDVVAAQKKRGLPAVRQEASIKEMVDAVSSFPHSRALYVVDESGMLAGVISYGKMLRHVFSQRDHEHLNPRHLMSLVTTETAEEMMEKEPVFAREDEDVEEVLRRMLGKNLKEIPVVDGENRLTADITLIDIMETLMTGENSTD